MHRKFINIAALLGALSVALGAFAAHALKDVASPADVEIFNTAVRYQFYHVFALLAVGLMFDKGRAGALRWSGIFFIIGIVLFSGSLYLMTWFHISNPGSGRWLGPVTPLGGLFFILGWLFVFAGMMAPRVKVKNENL